MAHGGPWKTKPVGAGLLYSPKWVYHIRCGNNYLMNLDQLAIRSLLEWSSISTIYVVTWRREVVSLAHSTSDNQPDHLKASINIAIFACAGFPSLTKRGGFNQTLPMPAAKLCRLQGWETEATAKAIHHEVMACREVRPYT